MGSSLSVYWIFLHLMILDNAQHSVKRAIQIVLRANFASIYIVYECVCVFVFHSLSWLAHSKYLSPVSSVSAVSGKSPMNWCQW